jgi:hypothetical protein
MSRENLGVAQVKLIGQIISEHFPGKTVFSTDDVLFIIKEMLTDEGKHYLTKDVQINNSKIYKRFVQFLFSKNLTNLDTMILLTAMKGGGKSSTAIQLAREWCNILGWKFSSKKYIAYTNADLMRKIKLLPDFSPLIADEAVRFVSSEDWNKKENKELKKFLAQVREKHMFFILCFPMKIKKVDKVYLDSFVNYWLEVYERGYTAVFVPDKNPVFDSWRLDSFKNIGTYNEFTPISVVEERLKKHPNFWKFLFIPKVPDSIYKSYKEYREANVYSSDRDLMNSISKDEIYRSLMLCALNDIMTVDKNFTMHRISLHIKNQYGIRLSKQDLTSLVEDAQKMVRSVKDTLALDNKVVMDEKAKIQV